jgi:hypothetical protein
LQTVPLSEKVAGTALLVPVMEALKPKLVPPLVGMLPFQLAFVTVTSAPDWLTVPFHSWVMVCPPLNDHVSRHPFTGSPRLSMVTLAPKPPGHWFVML